MNSLQFNAITDNYWKHNEVQVLRLSFYMVRNAHFQIGKMVKTNFPFVKFLRTKNSANLHAKTWSSDLLQFCYWFKISLLVFTYLQAYEDCSSLRFCWRNRIWKQKISSWSSTKSYIICQHQINSNFR